MYHIRPIRKEDFEAFEKFALTSHAGVTSLPKDRGLLKEKLERSLASFSRDITTPGQELYIFILEESATNRPVGTCSIVAKTGVTEPLYFYRLETHQTHTPFLEVPEEIQTLRVVSYPEGPTEIGGLYLLPELRNKGLGKLLSFCRFLFIASHPQRFTQTLIAEMRGVIEASDRCLFWEGVGRHFYNIPFVEELTRREHDSSFIPHILPQYPIYTSLLPQDIQQVIGQVHTHTLPAYTLLLNEGFHFTQEIGIFDGGPKIGTHVSEVRTIRESNLATIKEIVPSINNDRKVLLSNNHLNFRACLGTLQEDVAQEVILSTDTASTLQVTVGDLIRYTILEG